MPLDASFFGPPTTDYFALNSNPRFQRPAFVEQAYLVDPSMTSNSIAPWRDAVEKKLEWIASLGANWDGYGAAAVRREMLDRALRFLDAVMPSKGVTPDIGPTKDGYLQFDWHLLSTDLEIRMRPAGEFEVSFDDLEHPERSWDAIVTADLRRVVEIISEVSGRS